VINPVPAGGDCSSFLAICAEGYYCNNSTCAKGAQVGQDCDPSYIGLPSEDPSNQCLHQAFCKPSSSARGGTCTLLPAAGEACDPTGQNLCNAYFTTYCDPVSGVCRLRADLAKGICVAQGKVGDPCDPSVADDCMWELQCTNGKCETEPSLAVCL
jgi:hypothetical protein